jgi:hypothetical protein
MIILVNNIYSVSSSSLYIFNEKVRYISEILKKTKNDFTENEDILEEKFMIENNISDWTDLSSDDYELYTGQLEEYKDKHKHLPQILYKSLIVSIYSIIETTLSELINSTEKNIVKRIKYKHLRNSGNEIENYLNYFNLVHNLSLTNITELLNNLKNYADIRNNIVHFNGNLKEDNEGRKSRIKKFIKNDKSIEIEENENLYIKDCDFVFRFLDLTEKFSYVFLTNYKIEKKH